jgi:predicted dehydrogenase
MTAPLRIAVLGAGWIGRKHVDWLRQQPDCIVVGVADPSEAARAWCEGQRVDWTADYRKLLDQSLDGVIVATPNATHLPIGLDCIAKGLPMLMEKPLADTVAAATELALAARRAGVPVLVGHYRRHNPHVVAARRLIEAGAIGRLAAVSLRLAFLKPESYFAPEWRRSAGGGPVLINFIHDIDALRFLCGEIFAVQATYSSAARGLPVEDTAAILMTLANGALVTALLSDTVTSPYSWDINAAEDAVYPVYGKDAYLIGGTEGSLALPKLRLWAYGAAKGWQAPLSETACPVEPGDAYLLQAAHFLRVVRGEAVPAVSAVEATKNQIVADAIAEAASTGSRIELAGRFEALERGVSATAIAAGSPG